MRMRNALHAMTAYHPGERRAGVDKLSSNENPLGLSPAALRAAQEALSEGYIYPDGGAVELKEAIARRHDLDPTWILHGNGSDEVLTIAAATYINPGDRCLIAEHTFSQYEFAVRLFDGRPEIVPMRDLAYDLDAFAARLHDDVRAVFLCSPNNPTGLAIADSNFRRFMDTVPSKVLVVVDHAYQEYRTDGTALQASLLPAEYDNLLVLRTFSKIFGMAGFRLGYGIARPERVVEMERARLPFNVGLITQRAALAALEDSDFVERSTAMNLKSTARMYTFLDRYGYEYLETQANFVAIRIGERAAEFVEHCAQTGATIRHLKSFGLPDWVRITAGVDRQLDIIETAFATFS